MDGNTWPWLLPAVALGLWAQYAVIKAAVYHALVRFLRDASRTTDMREGYDVPRRIDRLATHLVKINRQSPPD